MKTPAASSAYDRLDPAVQRWIFRKEWKVLRDVQEAAVEPILAGDRDVVIAAATASGKTEAAFLPIFSRLLQEPASGLRALAVSPLKALINDQYDRLELISREVEVPVHRWHGDVGAGARRKVLGSPSGVLLITPESLEALFIRRGSEMRQLLGSLAYVVVDELHSFLGTERGRQLQSLLHRVELVVGRAIPRIALSATLGDMELALDFLRWQPDRPLGRVLITSEGHRQELRLQLRGYRTRAIPPRHSPPPIPDAEPSPEEEDPGEEETAAEDEVDICRHLFKVLRGQHGLVFANSRQNVETCADLLARLSARERVPNEFHPHHGNLSKELRESTEALLKDPARPATVVCTTTLEMGIDVGAIESTAQIGPPPSVASLRQRLGRSGRQGQPAVLRMYVRQQEITAKTEPVETLRPYLVQATAMVHLLLEGWYEPPIVGGLHLSTLVQQLLSLIAQLGAIKADQAWRALCGSGPFQQVEPGTFARFLRDLARRELIQQTHSGELVLDLPGERLVNHYSFYAAFSTQEEYRLVSGGKTLGSLPIDFPLFAGVRLIFAGRRWRVLSVDEERKVVDLASSPGGVPPRFGGGMGAVHDRVRQEMKRLLAGRDVPIFLNATARDLLEEGRQYFERYGLAETPLLVQGEDVWIFPWRGDRVLATLLVWLRREGFDCDDEGIALRLRKTTPKRLGQHLEAMATGGVPAGHDLARMVDNKQREKHHPYLGEELLAADYAATQLDPAGAFEVVGEILQASGRE